MGKTRKRRRLVDAYAFPGFRPRALVQGIFGDPQARLVSLVRRGKKRSAACAARRTGAGTIGVYGGYAICPVGHIGFTWSWKFGACTAAAVVR
jgi:hypothetical protein